MIFKVRRDLYDSMSRESHGVVASHIFCLLCVFPRKPQASVLRASISLLLVAPQLGGLASAGGISLKIQSACQFPVLWIGGYFVNR